ncbi:extracellular solute-binding protein [Stackebrandtia nassauensis]|uniref:ABC-type sugar transport system periplasmic component-like protein n=1 Tax=Stackebrandtia nassauensis (strain DSM 44728 / CIP 108903 / NRRL B-16338 / NBRC 102104 / LLR-40K-21) TaxID=446470 RepID=D3PY56_STANL|nr:extracellular solute-binding protein [Stackebrandtia nassauensis]ADD45385.1 ABC-type sugar transport system periplasmic component-like protein [Stackebrandtia nassauensis DSM 44728]
MSDFNLKRRDALKMGGVAALVSTAGPALVACSGGGGGDVSNKGKDLVPYPDYIKADGPEPDLPGDEKTGLQGGYTKYPKEIESTGWDKPGDGSKVRAAIITYGVPPKKNDSFVKAVNDALGVELDIELMPGNEWKEKMTTLTASDDMPDIVMFGVGEIIPREHEFIQANCADISDLVSGDNIKDYPGLANIPTYAWKGVGRIGGKLYGIPTERPVFGGCLMVNRTALDKVDAPVEWTKDEYVKAMAELTKGKKYGLGMSNDLWIDYWAGSLGAPNEWKVSGGKFTTAFETDQFKGAIEMLAKQFADKHVYPDSPNQPNIENKTHYANTTVHAYRDGWGAMGTKAFQDAKDGYTLDFGYPFADTDPTPWAGNGYFGYVVFKKAKKERLKMLLDICNYLAAPFGTKEYELFNYGVEGKHFERDGDGVPIATKLWEKENKTNYPISYISAAPLTLFYPGYPDQVERVYEWEKKVAGITIPNPMTGLRSKAVTQKYNECRKTVLDGVLDVIFRGKDMKSFDETLKKWHSKGGDVMAEELAEEYEASEE